MAYHSASQQITISQQSPDRSTHSSLAGNHNGKLYEGLTKLGFFDFPNKPSRKKYEKAKTPIIIQVYPSNGTHDLPDLERCQHPELLPEFLP